jgi:hypothetical protein
MPPNERAGALAGPVVAAEADSQSTTSSPAATFEWRRCDLHPWYGVSVILTDDAAPLCVPPLDGTPVHRLHASKPRAGARFCEVAA